MVHYPFEILFQVYHEATQGSPCNTGSKSPSEINREALIGDTDVLMPFY